MRVVHERCECCGGPYGRWRGTLRITVCERCERTGGTAPGPDPVSLGELLPDVLSLLGSLPQQPAPGRGRCRRCGTPAEWWRTARGRWVLLEPGERSSASVPAGSRWRVTADGTAVRLTGDAVGRVCRVTHWGVCVADSGAGTAAGPVGRSA